jgi:thiol-disulfide isomerase/thioredoxin
MAPDGIYKPNETTRRGAPPEHVLPPLPRAAQPKRTIGFKTFTFEHKAPGVFVCHERSVEDIVFGFARQSTLTLKEGLPATIAMEVRGDEGTPAKSTATLRLTMRRRLDAETMRRFASELERHFDAVQRYEETRDETILKRALEAATIESLQVELRRDLREHAEIAKFEQERAEAHGKRIGKPSPEWETEDFAGNKHSIAGYRGKVVLLDFWFRRCGWCIRAMPQIKQVAEHYKGKPVAVLGMNVDRKESDATFAIEKMKLEYPSLKARDISGKYAVMGYPTLVVIDKKGVVRHYHTGYSAYLRDELIALVDKLLAEPG